MRSRDAADLPTVEGYTLIELIGTGGFSRVFRAQQHGLGRDVAIKVLNASFEDERQRKTFERECHAMGRLSTHPNIVTVFASAITSTGQPCIIMELYEGTYRSDDQLEVPDLLDVGAKVADALQAVHEDGIVHRDIKPHNIFISNHGQPALGDFGISSIESERTVTGGGGFSINYAPPEVFQEGGTRPPGDIYSLGATLYQLGSGEVPFPHDGDPADRTRATVHKIIASPPPTLHRADAPADLNWLLQRCMAKTTTERPSTAAEVASELRRIQSKVVGSSPVQPRVPKHVERSQATTSSSRADRSPEGRRDVTVLRTVARHRSAEHAEPTVEEEPAGQSRRKLAIGVGVSAGLIGISALLIVLFGGRESTDDAASTTIAADTTTSTAFLLLVPPDGLEIARPDDFTAELTWDDIGGNVAYQVHHVESGQTRFTSEAQYTWILDEPGHACFEVRTTDADRTRASQSVAGPSCS